MAVCPICGEGCGGCPDPRDAEIARLNLRVAEQTARAEKAEALVERAEVAFHAAIARANQALAACAEMRAALEVVNQERNPNSDGYVDRLVRALLSRPDLGAGMVVVTGPLDALVDSLVRVVCDCHDGSDLQAHTRRDPEAFRRAVRGALLKKGGG